MLLKSQRCSENKRMTLTDQKLATLNNSSFQEQISSF